MHSYNQKSNTINIKNLLLSLISTVLRLAQNSIIILTTANLYQSRLIQCHNNNNNNWRQIGYNNYQNKGYPGNSIFVINIDMCISYLNLISPVPGGGAVHWTVIEVLSTREVWVTESYVCIYKFDVILYYSYQQNSMHAAWVAIACLYWHRISIMHPYALRIR